MANVHTIDASVHNPSRFQQLFVLTAKVLVGCGILYALFQTDYLDLMPLSKLSWSFGTTGLLAAALAFVVIAVGLLAWRLQMLLAQQGVCVSGQRAISFTLIGALFGAILPGLIGGDVVKAVYLCDSARDQRSKAVSTVIIDRIIGLYSLLLLGAIACFWAMLFGIHTIPMNIMATVVLIAVLATVGLSILLLSARTEWFDRLTEKLPRRLVNIVRSLADFCDRPGVILAAICLSLVSHGMVVFSFYTMAVLLGDALPLVTHFVVNPLAMVMNVVPLTPGGVGITEGAFAYLYEWCGSPQGAAVGLMGRIIQYLIFVVGGVMALLSTKIHIKDLLSSQRAD